MLGMRKENLVIWILIIIGIAVLLMWIFQAQIRASMLGTVTSISMYHSYMIGLVFPETLYIKFIWNPGSGRAHNPFTGRFMTIAFFVIIGASIAIGGYYISTYQMTPFFYSSFNSMITESFGGILLYGFWVPISIPLLAIVFFAIATPAGLMAALRSIKANMLGA